MSSLPTQEQLNLLHKALLTLNLPSQERSPWVYEQVKAFLDRSLEAVSDFAVESAKFTVDSVLEKGLNVTGVAVQGGSLKVGGIAIMGAGMVGLPPLSAVIGTWLTAYQVGRSYSAISNMHDLLNSAKAKAGSPAYRCTCKRCVVNIQYMIDKHEWKTNHAAIGVATFGIWAIVKVGHSGLKRVFGTSKKAEVSKQIVNSAWGCPIATAMIFLRVSEKETSPKKQIARVVAIMTAKDGWEAFKDLW